AYEDGHIQIWDWTARKLVQTLSHADLPKAPATLALNDDGRYLATHLTVNGGVEVGLWNVESAEVRTLQGHKGRVSAMAFHPDGRQLATVAADGMLRLWNTAEGPAHSIFHGHPAPVSSVAFSADGRQLAMG